MSAPVEFNQKNMIYTQLGNSGLRVSRFGFGGWINHSGAGDPVKECLKIAIENGVNFLDTAEVYAGGKCEEEWGKALKELGVAREDLVISTKLFFGYKGDKNGPNGRGLSRKHVVEGMNASLKRLQMDYVDIVMAHRPDVTTPMEEIVRAFNHLIETGKAFYWGHSEWTAVQIQEACLIADKLNLIRPICDQPHHSLLHRVKVDGEFLPLFEKYGMGTTIWSPLESGMLTGKYLDLVENGPPEGSRFATNAAVFKETIDKLKTPEGQETLDKVRKLKELAESLDTTVTRLSLAWTIRPGSNVSTCILGASKPEQILDNLAALDVVEKLTPELLEKIEAIVQNKPEGTPTYGR